MEELADGWSASPWGEGSVEFADMVLGSDGLGSGKAKERVSEFSNCRIRSPVNVSTQTGSTLNPPPI
ncbi:hypothetical protein [Streptomyces sp. XD-27]|uniref:hypothetical protein n=1 Tax=Streptomyces sp. XD-27 TaxID=3062779 RepID=UPI0026F47664|nr:hypothetical protein [Streptomyces sp. XD-27]WKX68634.1 hypothetical protein Q3Y56_00535 [Streptomyces sp. XD-27]